MKLTTSWPSIPFPLEDLLGIDTSHKEDAMHCHLQEFAHDAAHVAKDLRNEQQESEHLNRWRLVLLLVHEGALTGVPYRFGDEGAASIVQAM